MLMDYLLYQRMVL